MMAFKQCPECKANFDKWMVEYHKVREETGVLMHPNEDELRCDDCKAYVARRQAWFDRM